MKAAVALATLSVLCALPATVEAQSNPERVLSASRHDGYFIDRTGQRVEFNAVYEAWFGSDRYPPNYGRAVAENGALLLLELGIYWFDPDLNVVDWQFPDLGAKLTSRQAFRFDDNLLQTNYLFHSFAGASHYLFTRTNGIGVLGSFGAAAASSALYEMVFEWKELVSFNDLIVTPLGGMAMGEFFYHLGDYLNSEQPRPTMAVRPPPAALARDGARTMFGSIRGAHDAIDDRKKPIRVAPDNLGLSSAYAHEFRVLFGQDSIANETGDIGGLFSLDGEFELVAMPGFLRPGRFQRWFTQGNFTSFDLRLAVGDNWGRDAELCFDSHMFGWYSQDLMMGSNGVVGLANETSFGTALCYRNQELLGRVDQYGVVNILRPIERVWVRLGPVQLRMSADISPDFASVYSAAYQSYVRQFGREGTKSSLHRHGYFHGWGLSAGATAAISSGGFELGGSARHGHYESIDGAERVQEEVTYEPHSVESISNMRAYLRFEPAGSALSTRLELAQSIRAGTFGAFEASRTNRRMTVALGAHF